MVKESKDNKVRINKYISSMSGFSRRDADELILAGRVKLNDIPIAELGIKLDPTVDTVLIDNMPIVEKDLIVFKFYKPRRVLTAFRSSLGDNKQYEGKATLDKFAVFSDVKIAYAGRLDYDSEGLLLFSNNGDLINHIQRPENKLEKEYIVVVDKPLKYDEIKKFTQGAYRYKPCKLEIVGENTYKIILTEGKKRQIKEMFFIFKIRVKRLKRVRIGNILLGDIKPGECEVLSKNELRKLYSLIGWK